LKILELTQTDGRIVFSVLRSDSRCTLSPTSRFKIKNSIAQNVYIKSSVGFSPGILHIMQSPSAQYANEISQRLASSPSQLRSLDSPPPCKKKALLIGISSPSSSSPNSEDRVLRGPHKDVAQMKTLLVETYGYREQDIAVLVDDGILGNPQPERHQIVGLFCSISRFQDSYLSHQTAGVH
jgi:hypothetical protein